MKKVAREKIQAMRIYITHCTGIKNNKLRESGKLVAPDELYQSFFTQRFMARCKQQKVNWAIFSDQYGIWSPNEKKPWYEKHPDTVTEAEFQHLISDFDTKLKPYSEIWFYRHRGWFHPFYQKIIHHSALSNRIKLFSHIQNIGE